MLENTLVFPCFLWSKNIKSCIQVIETSFTFSSLQTLPPLDLDGLLTSAIESGRVFISVPWIVEFMNGIDDTSIQLPCYKIILAKLQYLLYKIKLPSNENLWDENIFCVYSDDLKNSIRNTNDDEKKIESGKFDNQMNILQLKELGMKTNSDFTKLFVDECLQTIESGRILITLYVNSLFNNVSVSKIIHVGGEYQLKILIFFVINFLFILCSFQRWRL
jgi:hypothetical protein